MSESTDDREPARPPQGDQGRSDDLPAELLDQEQLDAIAGGMEDYFIGTGYYCSVHSVVWPCPVMVTLASGETAACPGPKRKQFPLA